MSLPWWTGVPRAQATIKCGDHTHHLVWNDGVLTAVDHADPDGERVLAALGGEPLACISVLDAWHRHATDLDVLVLGSRGVADGVNQPRPGRALTLAQGQAVGFRPVAPPPSGASGPESHEEELNTLLSIGGGLARRLDATVAAHWRDRLLQPDHETNRVRARLHAALYGRVLATLIAWLGDGDVSLRLELAPESSTPALHLEPDGSIFARLPFGWLVDVHGRGLELIWGRLCLAAATTDGRSWELATVGPDLGVPVALTVNLPA